MEQDELFRRAFCKNPDGSWTCTEAATLYTPSGRVQVTAGTRFHRGKPFMGVDVAAWLEARLADTVRPCENT